MQIRLHLISLRYEPWVACCAQALGDLCALGVIVPFKTMNEVLKYTIN